MGYFEESLTDSVFLVDSEGQQHGPYRTRFSGNSSVKIYDETVVVAEGHKLIRPLPNGTTAAFTITDVAFHTASVKDEFVGRPNHWLLTLEKDSAMPKPTQGGTTNNISIHGSTGFQIGNHNSQQVQVVFQDLVSKIEASGGTDEEKQEAKGRLKQFLEHPLVATVVGESLAATLGLLS